MFSYVHLNKTDHVSTFATFCNIISICHDSKIKDPSIHKKMSFHNKLNYVVENSLHLFCLPH